MHHGTLNLGAVLLSGLLGANAGDQLGYWAGRKGGRPLVLRWGRYVLVIPGGLERAEMFFARHRGGAIFVACFVPGLRVFGALAAGTSRVPWERFLLYNALGGVTWATLAVEAGHLLWASSIALAAAMVVVLAFRRAYRQAMGLAGGTS